MFVGREEAEEGLFVEPHAAVAVYVAVSAREGGDELLVVGEGLELALGLTFGFWGLEVFCEARVNCSSCHL